jgi:hypothetical protein
MLVVNNLMLLHEFAIVECEAFSTIALFIFGNQDTPFFFLNT